MCRASMPAVPLVETIRRGGAPFENMVPLILPSPPKATVPRSLFKLGDRNGRTAGIPQCVVNCRQQIGYRKIRMLMQHFDRGARSFRGVDSVPQTIGQQKHAVSVHAGHAPLVAANIFAGLGRLHGACICPVL